MNGCFDMTRCLIVDEDREWQDQVLSYCAGLGLEFVATACEEDAIRHCASEMPDVVLVGTRQAAGFIRQLRRLGGGEPIVIHCPQKGDSRAVSEAIWNGASDYLLKPCSRELFDAKLRQSGVL
jgi:two-component system chemotaxis response regulator CheY